MHSLRKGNDYEGTSRITLAFTDADTSLPIDLTGATVWYAIKRRRSDLDVDAYLLVSTAGAIEVDADQVGAGKGKAYVAIDRADLADVPVGIWWWSAQALDSSSRIAEIGPGRVQVLHDVIATVA